MDFFLITLKGLVYFLMAAVVVWAVLQGTTTVQMIANGVYCVCVIAICTIIKWYVMR